MVKYFLCAYTERECICFGGETKGDRDIYGGGKEQREKKREAKTWREKEI